MRYELIKRSGESSMNATVNRLLREGWELQGGTSMSHSSGGTVYYCQAMVKRGEVKENKKPSKKIGSFTLKDFLDSDI